MARQSRPSGQSASSKIMAATATFGAVASGISTFKNIGAGLSGATDLASAGRLGMAGLTAGAEAIGDIMGAVSMFDDASSSSDWRVRLTLPNWVSFRNSAVLKPLKDAGGLVFPFTPEVSIGNSAKYTALAPTHANYPFQTYQNSDPGSIKITGAFNVEDQTQALYWIAAVHYLRSVTKMFSGYDPKAGNPPPLVFLNGYGAYVFKNVPVIITAMNLTLPKDVDYISCDVVGSAAGEIADIADSIGGLSDALGGAIGGAFSGITSTISSIAGGIGQVASTLGSFGLGGSTSGGTAHVPSASTLTVTCIPAYSRNSARNFSLDRFVQGGYMNNGTGYV